VKETSLVQQLFDGKQASAIKNLWKDEDNHFLIQKEIGKELISQEKIIVNNSLNQFCCITALASFSESEEESISVAVMLMYCLKNQDILPSLENHRGKAFASRALVCLGLFPQALQKRYERLGAPKPGYYRNVAKTWFEIENMKSISSHFIQWECFLNEMFP